MSVTSLIVVYCVVSCLVGVVIGYFFYSKTNIYRKLYLTTQEENTLFKQQILTKDSQNQELQSRLASQSTRLEYIEKERETLQSIKDETQNLKIVYREEITNLNAQNEFYNKQRTQDLNDIHQLKEMVAALEKEKNAISEMKKQTEIELNKIFSDNKNLNSRMEEQKKEFLRLQIESENRFENIAHKIFEEKSNSFNQKSEKTLQDVLLPVKEKFTEFQQLVHDKFNIQTGEQLFLKQELKRMIEVNEDMRCQADNLTKALRGDNKIMGNWGEMMLERILEDSGLTKDIDYVLQASGYQLKDEEGKRQIPDAIVQLPENKHIIIDAKVSLLDYERTLHDIDGKQQHEKNFLKSIRSHIDDLASKQYFQNDKLLSPDFVLMFMPIEGAYSLAMQFDSHLHNYAWNRRVALVCSTTLFATLRTVASLWRIEKQNKNAEEIARRAGLIFEKFCNFIEDVKKVDGQLNMANKTFDNAMNKLYLGKGNIVSQIETLKDLGAKTSKSIPTMNKEYLQEKQEV